MADRTFDDATAAKAAPHNFSRPTAISILGIPFDAGSTYLRGAALAPPLIREALRCDSSNVWTEDGISLEGPILLDRGDLALPDRAEEAGPLIASAVREALDRGHPLICLGGDHSVTYPIVRAFHERFPDLTILHFDAHPDLYDELRGRLSHACQFARIMEAPLARRLVQVGIRTMNGHQREQAQRFGVEVISMRHLDRLRHLRLEGPVYVSFDLDALDPAFAPGVSHHEPGGMSVRDALSVIQRIAAPVVGADIVEYNPTRDVHTQTAMVASKVLKEIAAVMLRGARRADDWV